MALPQSKIDEYYMSCALELAARGMECSPNPRVGCVLVRDGEIVGRGWHRKIRRPARRGERRTRRWRSRARSDGLRDARAVLALRQDAALRRPSDRTRRRALRRRNARPEPEGRRRGLRKARKGGHSGQGRRARGRMPLDEPRLHPPHDARTPVGDAENRRLARRQNRA